jgi:hypothetical protein
MIKQLKLHHIYFVLAGIDLITLACTLLLSHQMMSIHTQSVAENQVIAQRSSIAAMFRSSAPAVTKR